MNFLAELSILPQTQEQLDIAIQQTKEELQTGLIDKEKLKADLDYMQDYINHIYPLLNEL